jgi:hypothetical protein
MSASGNRLFERIELVWRLVDQLLGDALYPDFGIGHIVIRAGPGPDG